MAHGDPCILPTVSTKFDYEAELALVIGKKVPRHVSQEQALQYVFGYTCFNAHGRTDSWQSGKRSRSD